MIIYLVKSTLLLFLLLAVYKLLLEREKMHQFNRFFLLFALVFGLTAPLITFDLSPGTEVAGIELRKVEQIVEAPAEIITKTIAPKAIPQAESPEVKSLNKYPSLSISKEGFFLGVYGLITFLLFIRFGFGLFQIRSTIRSGEVSTFKHAKLVLVEETITPQSFLKHIFLNKDEFKSGKIGEEILLHEYTHVSQLHSLDVLFIELLKVPFWFNPILYFYKHAIQLNHEFIADSSVIQKSSSVESYQEKLIKACASDGTTSIMTTKFNQSNTGARLKMMRKESSLTRRSSKGLVLIPLLCLITLVFCTESSEQIDHIFGDSNGTVYYSDIDLISYPSPSHKKSKAKSILLGDLRYDPKGELYTGVQKFYLKGTNELNHEMIYRSGLNTGTIFYDEYGNVSKTTELNYENGRLISSFAYDSEGNEIQRFKAIYEDSVLKSYQVYFKNKLWSESRPLDNGLINYREYYKETEQLKTDASYDNSKGPFTYQGLMTFYDRDGNKLEQTLYRDGELMEKIK